MSEQEIKQTREKIDALLTLQRAPSQFGVLFHLLSTGRALTVKELSAELNLTAKATERAVAKLFEKDLIQRTLFRDGAYVCDSKQILLSLLLATAELYEYIKSESRKEPQKATSS